MALERGRPSVRTRGSYRSSALSSSHYNSSSSSGMDPEERCKRCCRNVVAFMFTQVGVGGLVIGYAILGAVAFVSIEVGGLDQINGEMNSTRQQTALALWNITRDVQFNHTRWSLETSDVLKHYQDSVVEAISRGYDSTTPETWSFPGALMFCLSVFTMIGFGNIVPRTTWGKIATMCYAVFGIPLYILYFLNMGEVFAESFKWVYTQIYRCKAERERRSRLAKMEIDVEALGAEAHQDHQIQVIVPTTACMYVLIGYLACGTIMFAEWEQWGYLDSCYFSFTSILKIGFGDFFPGANVRDSSEVNQVKLVINFMYLLVGMGLLAMCYYLLKEEVTMKVQEIRQSLKRCVMKCYSNVWICTDKHAPHGPHSPTATLSKSTHNRRHNTAQR